MTCSWAGVPAVPERLTVADPPVSLARVNPPRRSRTTVGEKEIDTDTDAPGASVVPVAGQPAHGERCRRQGRRR